MEPLAKLHRLIIPDPRGCGRSRNLPPPSSSIVGVLYVPYPLACCQSGLVFPIDEMLDATGPLQPRDQATLVVAEPVQKGQAQPGQDVTGESRFVSRSD